MAKTAADRTVERIAAAIPHLIRLPEGRLWVDYDRQADVLYISLKRPQRATDTIDHEGILLRYRGRELVGVTVLNASKRSRHGRKRRATANGRR